MIYKKKKEQQGGEAEQMLFPGFSKPREEQGALEKGANEAVRIRGVFGGREVREIEESEVLRVIEERRGALKLYDEGRKLIQVKEVGEVLKLIEEMSICYGEYDKGDVLCNKCGIRGLCKK